MVACGGSVVRTFRGGPVVALWLGRTAAERSGRMVSVYVTVAIRFLRITRGRGLVVRTTGQLGTPSAPSELYCLIPQGLWATPCLVLAVSEDLV